jgi:transposase-like protein
MKAAEFGKLLEVIAALPPGQRAELQRVLAGENDEAVVLAALTPDTRPPCPHCQSEHVIRWGRQHGLPRFRCEPCRRTFNPLSGSGLSGLKRRDRWMSYLASLASGRTLHAAAQEAGICVDTAHRWRHRFISRLGTQGKARQLSGIVEADETWVLESFKGRPKDRLAKRREPRKRGGAAARPGRSREQIHVLVARDRSGRTTDAVLPGLNQALLCTSMGPAIQPGSILCSDGHKSYPVFQAARAAARAAEHLGRRAFARRGLPPAKRQRLSQPAQGVSCPLQRRLHGVPRQLCPLVPRR